MSASIPPSASNGGFWAFKQFYHMLTNSVYFHRDEEKIIIIVVFFFIGLYLRLCVSIFFFLHSNMVPDGELTNQKPSPTAITSIQLYLAYISKIYHENLIA